MPRSSIVLVATGLIVGSLSWNFSADLAFGATELSTSASPIPSATPSSLPGVEVTASPTPTPTPTPTPAASQENPPEIEIDSIENGIVRLRIPSGMSAPSSIKTDLHDLKYLGTLKPEEGLPYFLFIGKPCENCAGDSAVYLLRPGQGKTTSFVYPGRILDSKTKNLLLESRAFFGRCLAGYGDAYVVFQKERVDRRRSLQTSVYIASVGKDRIIEKLIERRLPSINQALTFVKRKQCREIDGRYRVMVRRPLDLRYLSKEKDAEEEAKEGSETE